MKRYFLLIMILTTLLLKNSFGSGQIHDSYYGLEIFDHDCNELRNLVRDYHKEYLTSKICPALKKIMDSNDWSKLEFDDTTENMYAYFFAKAVRKNVQIIQQYTDMFEAGGHSQRLFLIKILSYCGSDLTDKFFSEQLAQNKYPDEKQEISEWLQKGFGSRKDIMNEKIADENDFGFLLMNFLATGRDDSINKLIDLFEHNSKLNDPNYEDLEDVTAHGLYLWGNKFKRVKYILSLQMEKRKGHAKKMLEEIIDGIDGSISIKEWVKSKPKSEPLTGVKAWAMGCSILCESNCEPLDRLETDSVDENIIKKEIESLDDWWGIKTREDLLETLDTLFEKGHRAGFRKLVWQVNDLSQEDFLKLLETYSKNKGKQADLLLARKYCKELGAKGILGWDFSRYIYLCRQGYTVGFLTEDEAWEKIIPIARMLQRNFDSWEDLANNYLIGRQYWSPKRMAENGYEFEDAIKRLREMPQSPWKKYSWNMSICRNEPNIFNPVDVVLAWRGTK